MSDEVVYEPEEIFSFDLTGPGVSVRRELDTMTALAVLRVVLRSLEPSEAVQRD